jgi:hypothetical protein
MLLGSALLIVAIWTLQHPYDGISYNDSTIYTLLALARLNPGPLSGDVFLRFGSQDSYTLFSPLFVAAIRLVDLEPAAALLTLASQIAFGLFAWLLARRVMSAREATLAVGLLVALPGGYGAGNFFAYIEGFLTPRQPAEALVLAALAACLTRPPVATHLALPPQESPPPRRIEVATFGCLAAALLLHPIMALGGIVMLAAHRVALPRPGLAAVLAISAFAASLLILWLLPWKPLAPFDATWLQLSTNSTPYLFLYQWSLRDWCHLALPLAVLGIGASGDTNRAARTLCRAALITAVASLTVTLVYCDLMHVVLFTQVQPWRWLWLVEVIAVLAVPVVAEDCRARGPSGVAALVLLTSAWLLRDDPASILVLLLSVGLFKAAGHPTLQSRARTILAAALLLVAVIVTISVVAKSSYVDTNGPEVYRDSPLMQGILRNWTSDGLICLSVLVAWWTWVWRRDGQPHWSVAVGGVSSVALVAVLLAPLSWHSWTNFHYTPAVHAAFAPWRAALEPSAEVIWPRNPVGAWYILDRPSYYSIHQVVGDIFFRDKAIEIHRRAAFLEKALEASQTRAQQQQTAPARTREVLPSGADKLDAQGFELACGDPHLAGVVSWNRIGPETAPPIAPNPRLPQRALHLFRCADLQNMHSRH